MTFEHVLNENITDQHEYIVVIPKALFHPCKPHELATMRDKVKIGKMED